MEKKGEVCLFFGSELLKMTYRQTTSASKVFLEMALDTYLYSYFERLKKNPSMETLDCTCSTLTAVSGVPSSGWSRADMWRAAVTPSGVERTLETKCDFEVTQQYRNWRRIIRVPAQLKL